MRISDWSSDVCSSDLRDLRAIPLTAAVAAVSLSSAMIRLMDESISSIEGSLAMSPIVPTLFRSSRPHFGALGGSVNGARRLRRGCGLLTPVTDSFLYKTIVARGVLKYPDLIPPNAP